MAPAKSIHSFPSISVTVDPEAKSAMLTFPFPTPRGTYFSLKSCISFVLCCLTVIIDTFLYHLCENYDTYLIYLKVPDLHKKWYQMKVDEIMLCSLNINKQAGYIYQQIYQHIKQAILNNQLQAYGKLPSKRKLSEQLGVSVNSVTSAYEQLVAEGY